MIFGRYINKYYLKFSYLIFLGVFALLMVDFFFLKIPNLYGMLINGINDGFVVVNGSPVPFDNDFLVKEICLPTIVCILALIVGRFLWRICFFGTAVKVETNLRNRMFNHSKNLSQEYYQVNKVGNLMSLYTNDLDTINECFGDGILMFFDAFILGVMALYKMWVMDKLLTLLALIPMALLLAIGTVVGISLTKKWEIRQQAFSNLSDFSQESFSGIAVIKAFCKELKELSAFKKLNKENERVNVNYTKASVLLNTLITLFVESIICVILGYGGYLVYAGQFNAGSLMEYIGYFTSIVWPIMAISMLIELTSRGKASLKRVTKLLDEKPTVVDKPDAQDIGTLKGDIQFKNLTFSHPGSNFDCLKNVSFTISAGENVGIVGKTGAGKTTIVDLLLKTYNVADGTIFLDGKDINDYTISSVRKNFSYVPQDNFLFSDTIANNIAFSGGNFTLDDIRNAAKDADVDQNIMDFTEQYDTVLGERGVTVSGGQKQRISIARALLKNAPILILDDSVSAVDTNTEKVILQNLSKSRKGKTTILIAHRISTVEQMDKIIFIDDGKVVAVGPSKVLYETCPEYAKMVDLQKLDEEGGGLNE